MRTIELLEALSQSGHGIECLLSNVYLPHATITTLYLPVISADGLTLFDAAIKVAQKMIKHPDCPPYVKRALDAYNQHTEYLRL